MPQCHSLHHRSFPSIYLSHSLDLFSFFLFTCLGILQERENERKRWREWKKAARYVEKFRPHQGIRKILGESKQESVGTGGKFWNTSSSWNLEKNWKRVEDRKYKIEEEKTREINWGKRMGDGRKLELEKMIDSIEWGRCWYKRDNWDLEAFEKERVFGPKILGSSYPLRFENFWIRRACILRLGKIWVRERVETERNYEALSLGFWKIRGKKWGRIFLFIILYLIITSPRKSAHHYNVSWCYADSWD